MGTLLWLVLAGWWLALGYVIAGIVNCILIVPIPLGIQSFKLAGYAIWPFGRVVIRRHDASSTTSLIGNIVWLIFGGLQLAVGHLFAGLVFCITIVGIPLGIASFKLVPLALVLFGKQVVPAPSDGRSLTAAG